MREGEAPLPMKLGLGLYRHMLTRENFRFARQAGATHLISSIEYLPELVSAGADQAVVPDAATVEPVPHVPEPRKTGTAD